VRFLVFLLSIFLAASPVSAQEKKKARKKAEAKQEWGHFSSGAKKDQKAMAKKKEQ